MFGFLSYFIEAFDKKNKLKNFTDNNLLHLYLSISSSLNPKYIDTTDDLLHFDEDLYDVMGRLIDTQYTILFRIKEKQGYKPDECFFLPWSNIENNGYSDGIYHFCKMSFNDMEYPDLINFSIIENQNEIKVYLYYFLCWLDRTIEMKNIKKFEIELNHACDQSKNYFHNKKTKFKDNLLSQLHIIDEAGYLFRRDELETFIKNINFK